MLHHDCEKLDPRIRRTRGLLQDALRNLLEQKEFDKISVQDITEAATLNRATFYAHYADKFALLGEMTRVNFLKLLEQRNVLFDGTCATAFHPIILAVCDYLIELQKSHSFNQHQFDPFVEATIIDQIRDRVARRIPAPSVGAHCAAGNDCRRGKLGNIWGGEAVGQDTGARPGGRICFSCSGISTTHPDGGNCAGPDR